MDLVHCGIYLYCVCANVMKRNLTVYPSTFKTLCIDYYCTVIFLAYLYRSFLRGGTTACSKFYLFDCVDIFVFCILDCE